MRKKIFLTQEQVAKFITYFSLQTSLSDGSMMRELMTMENKWFLMSLDLLAQKRKLIQEKIKDLMLECGIEEDLIKFHERMAIDSAENTLNIYTNTEEPPQYNT